MNEEIEYAEMLEIPVSTVNVVKRQRKAKRAPSLQQSLIDQVNERMSPQEDRPIEPLPAIETPEIPSQDFSTTLLEEEHSEEKPRRSLLKKWFNNKAADTPSKAGKIVYRVEIACACVLCFGIFLTNILVPGSAINTFFRSMTTQPTQEESLVFSDFELSSVVGEYSTATVSISDDGVVYFTSQGCVYPAVDGKVVDVSLKEEGGYAVTIEHSPTFSSIVSGVDHVYYEVGDQVKHNIPVAFSKGEREVQITMYSQGEPLTCLQIEGQNCLAWAEND